MRTGMNCWLALVTLLVAGSTAIAQNYVGDQVCGTCHENFPEPGFFAGYMNSGHPWKIFRTFGDVPAADTWPATPVPPLPFADGTELEWSDVEYVIGNYFWKARFIGRDGYIWTGGENDSTQWNLATEEFVPYHPGEDKAFDCGKCHTTGYDPEGHQNNLPGLVGTWTEDGVRCEACHGPSSEHAADPFSVSPPGGKDCAECHFRDADFRMPWKGGFMRHHQQGEDLSHSPHASYRCDTCHNPHRSTVYNDGGAIGHCTDCHPGDATNDFYVVAGMESLDCSDCHMPFMGKSAVAFNQFRADIRGHIFRIMTEPIAAADNVTDGFWNQDANGDAAITLDYACLGCHIDVGDGLTLEAAAAFAKNIHNPAANQPPIADPGGPYTGTPGQEVQFDGTGSFDPDGSIVAYLWDFGDGGISVEPTPTHTYATEGTYTVNLTVGDNGGALADETTTVEISGDPGGGGNTWTLRVPSNTSPGEIEFLVETEDFGGVVWFDETFPDGQVAFGIGMKSDEIIFWYDNMGALFYGMADDNAGTMMGIVFDFMGEPGHDTIFFGEQ